MIDFHFDHIEHKYTLGNLVVPGVTSLLKPLTDYDNVPEFMLQRAAERGRNVHEACAYWITGEGADEEQYTEEEWGYFTSFINWFHSEGNRLFKLQDERLVSERPMAHVRLRYGVTPDIIIDGTAIIELKTRPYNKLVDPLQVAAQEEAWLFNGGKRVKGGYPKYVLELRKDGKYKLHNAHHAQVWSMFRYLLEHHWKCREYQEKIEKWRKSK